MPNSGLPVIVVGGGPVGMTAATACAQAGLHVAVLEQSPVVATDWRASTFHPSTLELLGQQGVADQMHGETPGRLVEWFAAETNNVIARTCELEPRFRGVAGLFGL